MGTQLSIGNHSLTPTTASHLSTDQPPKMLDSDWLLAQAAHLSSRESIGIYKDIRTSMDGSISLLRRQLHASSLVVYPGRDALSWKLASVLRDYFWLFGANDFLEESISLYGALIISHRTTNDLRSLAELQDGLGDTLRGRFEQYGRVEDIQEAIDLHEKSLYLRANAGMSTNLSLHYLGAAFYARSFVDQGNSLDDDECAIQLLQHALDLSCSPDDQLPTLCYLALASWKAKRLPEGMIYAGRAFQMASPGHASHVLAGIAVITTHWLGDGSLRGWDTPTSAMKHYIFKLSVAINHPHAGLAFIIGQNLMDGCSDPGSLEAFLTDVRAVDGRFPPGYIYSRFLSVQTGIVLSAAYFETGSFAYLDECIAYGRRKICTYYTRREENPFLWINLANSLHNRYDMTGSPQDIDEAILIMEQVIIGGSRPQNSNLALHYKGVLGDLLIERFLLSGTISDLENGLDMHRKYLDIHKFTPDAPSRVYHISAAVDMFDTGYKYKRDVTGIETALSLLRATMPTLEPSESACLDAGHALAVTLCLLSEHTRDPAYVREALPIQVHALAQLPERSSQRSSFLARLALCRVCLWKITGAYEELHAAMQEFSEAVKDGTSAPLRRFRDALEWSRAAEHADSQLRLLALRQVITVRSKAVAFCGTTQARFHTLRIAPGLCADAAMHALACGDSITAVNLLEQGRAVFWGQALNGRRAPRGLQGPLSQRFVEVSKALAATSADYSLARQHALFEELEALETIARLSACSAEGPLRASIEHALPLTITLVATASSAAALVLPTGSSSILHVALPGVCINILRTMVNALHAEKELPKGLEPENTRKIVKMSQRNRLFTFDDILHKLWILIACPILQALDIKGGNLKARPRVFWCPTGLFSFLPIHAAGKYVGASTISLSDYVISSYIPAISALTEANHAPPTTPLTADSSRILLAAVPDAQGHTSLPWTVEEVTRTRQLLPRSVVLAGDITVEQFLTELPSTTFLHLACHGKQDPKDVLSSGFIFHDDVLKLSDLMTLPNPGACFAFLSTCESAMGDRTLPDENIHLAAAMLFVGYRSVIGTLWSMYDADGPKVADRVYRELLKNTERFDYDAVPRALDAAVRELREDGVPPNRWATWIHMGI